MGRPILVGAAEARVRSFCVKILSPLLTPGFPRGHDDAAQDQNATQDMDSPDRFTQQNQGLNTTEQRKAVIDKPGPDWADDCYGFVPALERDQRRPYT